MRKRISRACDECRLHKARCDGINPCETCQRYDRVCSYDLSPSECKDSAARIRILENCLIKANECITQLKRQAPSSAGVNVIRNSSSLNELRITKPKILTLAKPSADLDTGHHFIVSLLRPLSYDIKIKALAQSLTARSLLHDTTSTRNVLTTGFCQLPAYDLAIGRICVAFNSTFGLCSIIEEQDFRVGTQRLYDLHPIAYRQEDVEFIPLFHAVLALGMIHRSRSHLDYDNDNLVQESQLYFEAAACLTLNNDECLTIPKLQIRLCLVFYHLAASELNLARPMLQVICASSIVHNLLQSITSHGSKDLHISESRAKDIIWTIFYIDMHTSSLTLLPPLLQSPGPEMATIYAVNSAAHNVANYKRSSSTFLLSVSLAMAIELIKLVRRIFPARILTKSQSPSSLSSNPTTLADLRGWNKARTELQTWNYMFQNIFPENECNMQISLAGSELRLHHCLAEIMLYHNFLECLTESTAMSRCYEIDDINKGRACVAAATNAISHISTRFAQLPATNLTWSSAYTIFISALTLLVAAAFVHANERHTIHGTVLTAIQILQDNMYDNNHCKKSYLEVIQNLSESVMIPFNFTPLYRSTSLTEASATSVGGSTDWTASWCNSSPQGAPNLARLRLWPTRTDSRESEQWEFDSE